MPTLHKKSFCSSVLLFPKTFSIRVLFAFQFILYKTQQKFLILFGETNHYRGVFLENIHFFVAKHLSKVVQDLASRRSTPS